MIVMAFLAGILFFENDSKIPEAKAAAAQNIRGFAWSENIGWISFNCLNDYNGDGIEESHCTDTGYATDYGVNVNIDNTLSGYAWSENIGWISFNRMTCQGGANQGEGCSSNSDCASNDCRDTAPGATGVPPGLPYNTGGETYTAKLDGSNNLTGWARVLANGGGWDGWIKFNNAAPVYGVNLNGVDFEGFAWSDMVVGWLSFNSKDCDPNGDGNPSDGPAACFEAGRNYAINPIPDYKVYLSAPLNIPPDVDPLGTNQDLINYCIESFLGINLSWGFIDPDPADVNQTAYEVNITRSSDNKVCNSGKRTSSSTTLVGNMINSFNSIPDDLGNTDSDCANFLRYRAGSGETYSWEVIVYDSMGAASAAKPGSIFFFADHQYPDIDFSPPVPSSFIVNSSIDFINNSACYGTGFPCSTFAWDFCGGITNPALQAQGNCATADRTSNLQNPSHIYDVSGAYDIILTVTDNDGYACSNPSNTKVLGSVKPKWKEVVPK